MERPHARIGDRVDGLDSDAQRGVGDARFHRGLPGFSKAPDAARASVARDDAHMIDRHRTFGFAAAAAAVLSLLVLIQHAATGMLGLGDLAYAACALLAGAAAAKNFGAAGR